MDENRGKSGGTFPTVVRNYYVCLVSARCKSTENALNPPKRRKPALLFFPVIYKAFAGGTVLFGRKYRKRRRIGKGRNEKELGRNR